MLVYERFVVGMLSNNVYLVWDDSSREAMVVDPAGPCEELERVVSNKGLEVVLLVLTHGHPDHLGGLGRYVELYGARVAMSSEDLAVAASGLGELKDLLLGEELDGIELDLDLSCEDQVRIGDETLSVIRTPGHTPGSVCLYCDSCSPPLLFSGDTLFFRSVGRTDLPGGDYRALLRSLSLLEGLPGHTLVLPGHGPSTTIAQERAHNPFWPRRR